MLPAVIDLASLDGANGFRLDGAAEGDFSGVSVSGAGDVNGDGFADFLIGASSADLPGRAMAGVTYVVFGSAAGFDASLPLSALDGTNGFRLDGAEAGDRSGIAVSRAGDVNGDGIDDILVGAPSTASLTANLGATYVVYGTTAGFAPSLDLAALDGTNGFRIDAIDRGGAEGELSGYAVADAGDVNGDGVDDILLAAHGAAPGGRLGAGEAYVVFGNTAGFGESLCLTALDGTNGFRLEGLAAADWTGFAVAGAGDVNGDGVDDILVGAPFATPDGRTAAGRTYVVFGSATGFGASLDLAALDGTNGFRIDGLRAGDESGRTVDGAGDVNGDGIHDIVIGAWSGGADRAGETHVVFGSATGFGASLDLATLDGTNGFRIAGVNGSVARAGDVNADGIDDLLIGRSLASPDGKANAGETCIVFGATTGFGPSFDLAALNGTNGVRIPGIAAGDIGGHSVSGAGDVNGDGIDDIVIGAPGADPGGLTAAGESYVVFGSAAPPVFPITIEARGSGIPGASPHFVVYADGVAIGSGTIAAPASRLSLASWETFTFEAAAPPTRLEIVYDNDRRAPDGTDLNLGIGSVAFGGRTYLPSTDGLYVRATGQVVGPQGAMYWNGTLSFEAETEQVVTLRLAGTGDADVSPEFRVLADGVEIGRGTIAAPAASSAGLVWDSFAFRYFDTGPAEEVVVEFINDQRTPVNNIDVNLYVDTVSFGGETYVSLEDSVYIRARDGADLGPSRGMWWNGALIFDAQDAELGLLG